LVVKISNASANTHAQCTHQMAQGNARPLQTVEMVAKDFTVCTHAHVE